MKFTPINHQFSLFNEATMRPKLKVPISASRIREARDLMEQGDSMGAARAMRQVRETLEDYESRLINKSK